MAQRPDLNQVIHIRILNWNQYVGHGKKGRLKSPLFIKIPTDFFRSSRLDMEPGLYRFFCYLIYFASQQDVPGDVHCASRVLTRYVRCAHRVCTAYVRRLSEMQLIQVLSDLENPRREEKKREEVVVNNKGNLTQHVNSDAETTDKQKELRPAGAELVSRPAAAQHSGRPAAAINNHWLIDVWNENRGELVECLGVDDKTLERIESVVEKIPDREKWANAIAAVAGSPWALGKTDKKSWPSRFDLALKPLFWEVAAQAIKKKNNAALIESSAAKKRSSTATKYHLDGPTSAKAAAEAISNLFPAFSRSAGVNKNS